MTEVKHIAVPCTVDREIMAHTVRVLYQHWEELQFIEIDIVIRHLVAEGIIEHHEFNYIINNNNTRHNKMLLLVNSLILGRDDAFRLFLKSLRRVGQDRLATILGTVVTFMHSQDRGGDCALVCLKLKFPTFNAMNMFGTPIFANIRTMVTQQQNRQRHWEDIGQNLRINGAILSRMDQGSVGPLLTMSNLLEEWINSSSEDQSTFRESYVKWYQRITQIELDTIIEIICDTP
ncbi:unnamed protein product [Darwinula stevensoni]|uniref:CARD domain-containing protein n=1 Tax=Darwinula stevensoni TaxID=69355 RepID=A0A7R8X7R0_9CRUS|nr:unnamed protein product [Darwinula stevensoni]CAG0888955.1 unnamed protein product [Darwinula stevensoni]